MRIALFTDHFYPELGGIQDSIITSARELGARGHAVAIFAPAAAPRNYADAGRAAAEPDMGAMVRVHRLFALPVPSSTGRSRLAVPTGHGWRQLAAFRPDIIHSHSFLGIGREAQLAARRLGVKIVGTRPLGDRRLQPVLSFGAGRSRPWSLAHACTLLQSLHPTWARGSTCEGASSTKRRTPSTEVRLAFAVLTTERKAA